MDYGLQGRVALVTGAASGIGRATAELFARNGARVVASDVNAEAGAAVVGALNQGGAQARFVAADVTDGDALGAVVQEAVAAFGRLDCAANCAGVGGGHAATHQYPEAEWNRIVDINLHGTWLSMRAEIEAMLTGGGGAIVNVSSTLGLRGSPFAAPYSASKHAVLGLTRTAALEYAGAGHPRQRGVPGRDRHADDGRDLRALPGLPRDADELRAHGPDGRPRGGRRRDRLAELRCGLVRHGRGADG